MNSTTTSNNVNISSSSRNGNGTTQACAACKYQRRKCAPDCMLAPYFPHDRQRQFLNAHKLFGVRNITRIIEKLDPLEKDQAMQSIIIQSDVRANDPVGGCYRIIQELQTQIDYYRAELDIVLQQLAIFRAQAHHQHAAHAQAHVQAQHVYMSSSSAEHAANASNVNGDEVLNADPLHLYNAAAAGTHHYHYMQQQVVPQHEQYIMLQDDNNNNNSASLQEDVNSWDMQNSVSLSALSLHGKNGNVNVGDDYVHKPMFEVASDEKIDLRFEPEDKIDLRFEPEDLVERSDEAILFKIDNTIVKAEADCMQQAQDHDLKGAATLFTLTNCTS